MKILISGASGLIGSHVSKYLSSKDFTVWSLVRSKTENNNTIFWAPSKESIESIDILEGFDVVINLSGENIVGRWTDRKKKLIRSSRVDTTNYLVDLFGKLKNPPKLFISASAIGYYGDRGDTKLTEESDPGSGFLEDVSIEWENAANKAKELGVRVVNLRIGVVLSKDGGALAKMLPLFKFGLGGVVGSGDQYWSWISIDDLSLMVEFIINNEEIKGPVNAVSPNPVNCKEFTKTFSKVLNRPAIIPVPSKVIKLVFGEMGEHAVLASTRVIPKKLLNSGYNFHDPTLEIALKNIL